MKSKIAAAAILNLVKWHFWSRDPIYGAIVYLHNSCVCVKLHLTIRGRGKMAQCFVFITELLLVLSVFNCFYYSSTAEATSFERIDCVRVLFGKHLSQNLGVFNTHLAVGVVGGDVRTL